MGKITVEHLFLNREELDPLDPIEIQELELELAEIEAEIKEDNNDAD